MDNYTQKFKVSLGLFVAVGLAIFVIASHSLIPHKEHRFVYLVLPLALTLASIGIVEVVSSWNARSSRILSPRFTVAFGLLFFFLSSLSLFVKFHGWYKTEGGIATMDRLSQDSTLCGIGIYQFDWWNSGGYVHLHRNVPILPLSDSAELMRDAPSFNALLAPLPNPGIPSSFKPAACWDGLCLLRREGGCAPPPPGDEINSVLKAQN